MSEPVRYLGRIDLAARAGITAKTAENYQRDGYLPAPDVVITNGARSVKGWLPETVDTWLANRPGRGARTDLRR
ncbi:helix-turn-helix transcriptional regulator [Actinomyces faecalis]|uniref:helix-turn-helix transcriptional regulator n=1 Tax=Actinomyces faecalis TaxID=2722820 RepID=UPI0015545120|nr:transcriptional regulator [Actinomyces faecalis]